MRGPVIVNSESNPELTKIHQVNSFSECIWLPSKVEGVKKVKFTEDRGRGVEERLLSASHITVSEGL